MPDDSYPFSHELPPMPPRTFADWAPIVMGHLQRIESGQAVLIRDIAVIQAKMENDREWRAEVDTRLLDLERKQQAAAIVDAGRVGMVAGGWKLWTAPVGAAGAVAGAVSWLVTHKPN